jgi:hemerythrin
MTGDRDLTCDICGESFKTKDALGGHTSSHSRRISEAQLLAEIDRLVDEFGRSPTTTEMDSVGAYSAGTYEDRFGSWNKALQSAGYEPVKQHRISEDAILDEISRLATEIGTPPTASEMRSKGKFTVTIAQDRFGSWNEALEAAGYDPHKRHRITDEALLEEIHRLVKELGKTPTAQEMDDHGKFSHRPYFNRWEGWRAAIRAAGYEPVGRPSGPDNYNWKEQPAHEWREYGDNWNEQRQKVLERDNYTCQTPGCEWTQEAHREEFTRGLHVHHIRPLSAFGDDENEVNFKRANRLDNLVTVCAEHHHLWERASPLRLDTR